MILREMLIYGLSFAALAAAVAGYLLAFHGSVPAKDVLSNAFAGTIGVGLGRAIERRLARG